MSEPTKYHCSVCGKEEAWGDGWQWWGYLDGDHLTTRIACSDECRDKVGA